MSGTSQNFINPFKKLFSLTYLQHSETANCVEDFVAIVTKINTCAVAEAFQKEVPNQSDTLRFNLTDFQEIDLSNRECFVLCVYLFKKYSDIYD